MAFDPTDRTYRELLDRVLQTEGRVVPFIGAGLSVYGEDGERLPLWPELLDALVEEGRSLGLINSTDERAIAEAMRSKQYIEATDRILDALGEPVFRRTVETELDERSQPMPPAITELVGIDWPVIVTTNLDRLIATAYMERRERPISTVTNLDTRRVLDVFGGTVTSPETILIQIHGDLDTYPSWKLTTTHYERLLQDTGYVEAMKHLFLRQVFFVGFGLRDDDFDYLFDTIADIDSAGIGEIYALIGISRRECENVQRLIKVSGLRPIFYDDEPSDASGPFGKHRAVYECLAHMTKEWAVVNAKLNVTLKYLPELDPHMVRREADIDRLGALVESGGIVQVVGMGGAGKTSLVQQWLADQRAQLVAGGLTSVFGCSLYRADIGLFIQDLALSTVGPVVEPLPQRVERICEHVRAHRTLLFIDGAEVVLDERGRIGNPYMTQIVDAVIEGGGVVLLTSRIPAGGGAFEGASMLEVPPLSQSEIRDFLDSWGLEGLPESAKRKLTEVTAGHPLALRVLAGLLMDVPERDAVATIERSSIIDITDEVDSLRENRLARVIGSYLKHLNDEETAFLACSTVFDGPVAFPLVEATLTRSYADTAVNRPLLGRDLRTVVESLRKRRLLTVGTEAELSSHPTVRDYFDRRARESDQPLQPLHRFLAAEYLRFAAALPDAFEEAVPLLAAARHAAACTDWALFDDLFRRRLMRGSRQYLCNNLGAWEEALSLARLGVGNDIPAPVVAEPAFYPATVARCLKHLGRSGESRARYLDALRYAAQGRDRNTAKYVNNFLTLLIWRGELDAADSMVEVNVRALSWIDEEWKHRWQVEHGFATFAYLRMLQGANGPAETLFEFAATAWEGFGGERAWMYDYYPYHRGELVLLTDPTAHEEALSSIESLLTVAAKQGWPESICRGQIQAASVYLDQAELLRDAGELIRADRRLDEARRIPVGMNLPDVTIAYLLGRLRSEVAHYEIYGEARLDRGEAERLLRRLEQIVESSGLALAAPDAIAARGAFAFLRSETDRAQECLTRAVAECVRQGNVLALESCRSFVGWLGRRFDSSVAVEPRAPTFEPIASVGESLDPDWMLDRLDHLHLERTPCYPS
jgi:hypothetical protein